MSKTLHASVVAFKYFPNRVRYFHIKKELDPLLDDFMLKQFKFSSKIRAEVIIRLNNIYYETIKQYDTRSDFTTWALNICRNECVFKDGRIMLELKNSLK